MAKIIILKNTTSNDIELINLGETVPANDQLDLTNTPSSKLRDDSTLLTSIVSGDIVVNDGDIDLDSTIGYKYVSIDAINDEDGFWYGNRRRFSVLWNQTNHGFVVGQVIQLNESTGQATLALADTHANSTTTAVVSEVIDTDSFYAGLPGAFIQNIDPTAIDGGLPLQAGTAYFLSSTHPGQLTSQVPTGAGEIVKLIGLATGNNSMVVSSYLGYENETAIQSSDVNIASAGNMVRGRSSWQKKILGMGVNDPSTLTPTEGDRYIVGSSPVGDFINHDNEIAEYVQSSSSWHFTPTERGYVVIEEPTSHLYAYTGSEWIRITRDIINTINADVGSYTAQTPTDIINIVGTNGIQTSFTGDTLTITDATQVTDLPSITLGLTSNVNIQTTMTDVVWDTTFIENIPSVLEHDSTDRSKILVKETGLYLIGFSISFDADSGEEQISSQVLRNGTDVIPGSFRLASEDDEINDLSNVFTAHLNAGDFLTFQVQASGTGNLLHYSTTFSITRVKGVKGDPGPTGAGSNIIIESDNVPVVNTPHSTINFANTFSVNDNNDGSVTVENVFGSHYRYAEDEGVTTTTSTTMQEKLSLNTGSIPAGTYRIGWSYQWNHNSTGNDFEAQLQLDDTTNLMRHKQEPKDAAGSFSTTGTSQKYQTSGFKHVTLAAGSHTIDLDFRTDTSGTKSSIWNARIELWRVN